MRNRRVILFCIVLLCQSASAENPFVNYSNPLILSDERPASTIKDEHSEAQVTNPPSSEESATENVIATKPEQSLKPEAKKPAQNIEQITQASSHFGTFPVYFDASLDKRRSAVEGSLQSLLRLSTCQEESFDKVHLMMWKDLGQIFAAIGLKENGLHIGSVQHRAFQLLEKHCEGRYKGPQSDRQKNVESCRDQLWGKLYLLIERFGKDNVDQAFKAEVRPKKEKPEEPYTKEGISKRLKEDFENSDSHTHALITNFTNAARGKVNGLNAKLFDLSCNTLVDLEYATYDNRELPPNRSEDYPDVLGNPILANRDEVKSLEDLGVNLALIKKYGGLIENHWIVRKMIEEGKNIKAFNGKSFTIKPDAIFVGMANWWKHKELLGNTFAYTITDFTQDRSNPRFYVFNPRNGGLLNLDTTSKNKDGKPEKSIPAVLLTTHGSRSGKYDKVAKTFDSGEGNGSFKTPQGFHLTHPEAVYSPNLGRMILYVNGLEDRNANSGNGAIDTPLNESNDWRGVGVHISNYNTLDRKVPGASGGCPTIPKEYIDSYFKVASDSGFYFFTKEDYK